MGGKRYLNIRTLWLMAMSIMFGRGSIMSRDSTTATGSGAASALKDQGHKDEQDLPNDQGVKGQNTTNKQAPRVTYEDYQANHGHEHSLVAGRDVFEAIDGLADGTLTLITITAGRM